MTKDKGQTNNKRHKDRTKRRKIKGGEKTKGQKQSDKGTYKTKRQRTNK